MPITSSAKKALRSSKKKKIFNLRRVGAVENTVKRIKKLLKDKNLKEVEKMIPLAYKAIDKAVKGNTIKKGAGSRKKSRLMKLINKKFAGDKK